LTIVGDLLRLIEYREGTGRTSLRTLVLCLDAFVDWRVRKNLNRGHDVDEVCNICVYP
jgi:hypothetical protein